MEKASGKTRRKRARKALFALVTGGALFMAALPAGAESAGQTAEAAPWGRLLSLGILLLLCILVVVIGRFNNPKK